MYKQLFLVLLMAFSVVSCGGGSGDSGSTSTNTNTPSPSGGSDNSGSSSGGSSSSSGNSGSGDSSGAGDNSGSGDSSGSGDNSGSGDGSGDGSDNGQSSQPALKPNSSISLGRTINVLVLHSHTSDQRALRQDEIDASFELVKQVLAYNQVTNTYQVSYAQYDSTQSSQEMLAYNTESGDYPESNALVQSAWLNDSANIDTLNRADIVVLRTSFNSENTSGSFWGAGTGETPIWPKLAAIEGIKRELVFFNAPTDPQTQGFAYPHNPYLADDLKISRFDRIFAHEFIHALGYHAHDEGVDVHQTEAFSTRVRDDLAYSPTVGDILSYGDCFSVMGNSDCSLMLSPSAKELLGVNLDAVSVYQTQKVQLAKGQVLKALLDQSTGITGHEDILTYITLATPDNSQYGQSLNGDIELADANHSLQANQQGYLLRLVKVDVATETTPNVVLLDASPPLNDVDYTLKVGDSISVGGKVKIDYLSQTGEQAEFQVTYL